MIDLHCDELQRRRASAWCALHLTILLLALAVLLGRVIQLKAHPGSRLLDSIATTVSTRGELGRRGDVYDSRQRLLATSTVGHRLFVDPEAVADSATIAVDLAAVIGGDPVGIDRKIAARRSPRYVVIEPLLDDGRAAAVRAAGLRGVGLEPRLVRRYPQGDIAAALVGMVGLDHDGLGGTEHQFDDMLAATDGSLRFVRDARRRPLWVEPGDYRPAADGGDVHLTIDLVIQQIAEERLQRAITDFDAAGGRIVAVRPATGEILALADVINPDPGREILLSDPSRDLHPALGRSRCATDPYEPGSTFKPIVWAAATELRRASPDEIIPTPTDSYHRTSHGRLIRDTKLLGPVSWRRVLVDSLNSGMAIVAERLSHRELQQAIARFGLGQRTACGIPGESAGIVTVPAAWSHYTQTSVAMGHEIAVTPLQMVRAFCVFARDGTLPALRLAGDADTEYRYVERACSAEIARLTREVMGDVVDNKALLRGGPYRLFGKSGTAQLPKPGGGGYFEDRHVSSFIAGAPFDDPQIVVLCVIDDPLRSKGHWGSATAGPVVKDVIDAALPYLGVAPDAAAAE